MKEPPPHRRGFSLFIGRLAAVYLLPQAAQLGPIGAPPPSAGGRTAENKGLELDRGDRAVNLLRLHFAGLLSCWGARLPQLTQQPFLTPKYKERAVRRLGQR